MANTILKIAVPPATNNPLFGLYVIEFPKYKFVVPIPVHTLPLEEYAIVFVLQDPTAINLLFAQTKPFPLIPKIVVARPVHVNIELLLL